MDRRQRLESLSASISESPLRMCAGGCPSLFPSLGLPRPPCGAAQELLEGLPAVVANSLLQHSGTRARQERGRVGEGGVSLKIMGTIS